MNRCPVSVIIPTCNRAALLPRAVKSILNQTVSCSQLIIVDDGSTDGSIGIIKKLLKNYSLETTIYQQENRGAAAARNRGIELASQPYIAFLDSDDHWRKKKLEIQFDCLQRAEVDGFLISHTQEKWLRRGIHLNQKNIHKPRHGKIYDHCLQLCAVGMSTVMLKKSLFEKVGFFDEFLRCCEDYDFWLRVSSRFDFFLIGEPLTVKEGGRDDQVSVIYRQGMDKLRIYSLMKMLDSAFLDEQTMVQTFQVFRKKVTIYGKGCIKHGKNDEGQRYLRLIPRYRSKILNLFPNFTESYNDSL